MTRSSTRSSGAHSRKRASRRKGESDGKGVTGLESPIRTPASSFPPRTSSTMLSRSSSKASTAKTSSTSSTSGTTMAIAAQWWVAPHFEREGGRLEPRKPAAIPPSAAIRDVFDDGDHVWVSLQYNDAENSERCNDGDIRVTAWFDEAFCKGRHMDRLRDEQKHRREERRRLRAYWAKEALKDSMNRSAETVRQAHFEAREFTFSFLDGLISLVRKVAPRLSRICKEFLKLEHLLQAEQVAYLQESLKQLSIALDLVHTSSEMRWNENVGAMSEFIIRPPLGDCRHAVSIVMRIILSGLSIMHNGSAPESSPADGGPAELEDGGSGLYGSLNVSGMACAGF